MVLAIVTWQILNYTYLTFFVKKFFEIITFPAFINISHAYLLYHCCTLIHRINPFVPNATNAAFVSQRTNGLIMSLNILILLFSILNITTKVTLPAFVLKEIVSSCGEVKLCDANFNWSRDWSNKSILSINFISTIQVKTIT